MPGNEDQHDVQRCHLKPFTRDGAGLAINLFNHATGRVVLDAPVRNQCSHSSFDGRDLVLEKMLQGDECKYAAIVRDVIAGTPTDESQRRLLFDFAWFQWAGLRPPWSGGGRRAGAMGSRSWRRGRQARSPVATGAVCTSVVVPGLLALAGIRIRF